MKLDSKKRKTLLMVISVLSAILALFAMNRLNALRAPSEGAPEMSRGHVIGYGFVMIFGCITFVRSIFAIRRLNEHPLK